VNLSQPGDEGNEAVELEVPGFVDNAHTASAQVHENLVVRDCCADHGASGFTILVWEKIRQASARINFNPARITLLFETGVSIFCEHASGSHAE